MNGKRRFADILLEWMENGMLVRRNYILPGELKEFCTEPEAFEMYNRMAKLLVEARERELREFDAMVDEALELWMEIEHKFPLLSEEDVEGLVRKNVGFVDSRKCVEIAVRIGKRPPVKFTDTLDMARRCDSFKKIMGSSMNRVLSRVLAYLESSGLLIKTWASGSKGRKVRSMYFRIYKVFEYRKQECRECGFIRELKELLRKFEANSSEKVRGSNFQDNHTQHSEE